MARGRTANPGDTRVSPNGYHYTKTDKKWELTHRLTIERHLGRPLAEDERCKFAPGFDKAKDYNNPAAILVYKIKEQSAGSKLANLYAKRDEIQAQIDALEAEDS
jgi:hypothetical protein